MTVTLHVWYLLPYLAVGVLLWLPLNWLAIRQIHQHGPFVDEMLHDIRRHGVLGSVGRFVLQVTLWPVAIWEIAR